MSGVTRVQEERTELVEPTADLEKAFMRAVDDYRAAGEEFDRFMGQLVDDFGSYLRRCEDFAAGRAVPVGLVPQTTFWLVRNGDAITATGRLRHRLNPALEKEGGHIGYSVCPSERRKGYARSTVNAALAFAKADGYDTAILQSSPAGQPLYRALAFSEAGEYIEFAVK